MAFHTVPVVADLSNSEFLRHHVLARQPVVIKGALSTWNALRWDAAYLKARAGRRRIRYRTEDAPRIGTFAELVDRIFDGEPNAPYLRNVDLAEQLPELVDDVSPQPVYSRDNLRSRASMPNRWPEAVKKGAYELFVSPASASFPYLHIDYWGMSAFFAQIAGEKQVILFPPDDAPHLYPTAADPLVSQIVDFDDLCRYPKLQCARQYRVTIGPGDLLYNPGWWHTTQTTRTAITVIWAYWNRHEWANLVAAVRAAGGMRGRLLAPYLELVGMWNRVAG
jgi:histone arginine demethylase JMJD6